MTVTGIIVLLCFISSVVKVYSQTVPRISFKNNNLPNHSYIDLTLVGNNEDGSDSVQCHTDLRTCCSGAQGPDRGDWFFPNGVQLPFPYNTPSLVYQSRLAERVDIRVRGSPTLLNGVYHCDIETSATSDNNRETFYVGLYQSTDRGQYMCIYIHNACIIPDTHRMLCIVAQAQLLYSFN